MTIINGGLINTGGGGSSSSSSTLAISDGLACFTGSFSGVTTTSISHNLNSSSLVVEFKDSTGNLLIPDTWSITNPNVIEAEFNPAATGDVTIIACTESGLAPITGGVTTVEGLSGIVDFDSPNGSILITTSGQVVNFNAIFTPASGAVLEQKCRDITILSGLIGTGGGGGVTSINNISGIVTLTSTNNGLEIGVNGQSVEFTPLFTYTSGQIIDQNTQDLLRLSGLILPDDGQTSINGLSGAVALISPDGTILIGDSPSTLELSGLFTQASGAVLEQHSQDLLDISGLIIPGAGQTSINGLSGVVTLASPDESVNINVNGQTVELTTPSGAPSGASYLLREYNDNNHLPTARILSATSGVRLDDQGIRSTSGYVVTLDFDNEPSIDQVLVWNGTKLTWSDQTGIGGAINTSGVACFNTNFNPASGTNFVIYHGLGTEDFAFQLYDRNVNPRQFVIPTNITPSGSDHAQIVLDTAMSGRLVLLSCGSSGVTTVDSGSAGVTSIEGLSGVVDLDSPSSSIAITVSGQIIQLDSIFTWTSGQLLESLANASGVETLNGISGVVDLVAANNGIIVTNNGQVIELTTLFTYASGQLVDQNTQDVLTVSGLLGGGDSGQTSINGLSGTVSITSPDGTILVGDGPQAIHLSGLFTATSGALLQQHSTDLLTLSGLIGIGGGSVSSSGVACFATDFSPASGTDFVIYHGLGTQDFAFQLYDRGVTPRQFTIPTNITPSGSNHAQVIIDTAMSGRLVLLACGASGIQGSNAGVTSIEGLSGIVDLDSLNDGIIITTSGQVIQLSSLFTSASGQLVDQNTQDILTVSGLIGTGTGGSDAVSGLPCFAEDFLPTSGTDFIIFHGLGTENFTFQLYDRGVNPKQYVLPTNVTPSGSNHAQIILDQSMSGNLILMACGSSGVTPAFGGVGSVNGLSGAINIVAGNNGITIGADGQNIEVSSLFTYTSGQIIDQKCVEITSLSGVVDALPSKAVLEFTETSGTSFVMHHGLNTLNWTFNMWKKSDSGDIQNYIFPNLLRPSGVNHVEVGLNSVMIGALTIIG